MAGKKLVLVTTESGCIVPTSHKLNKDGYFRRKFPAGKHQMYHRWVWEQTHGEIPEGYEIDHICRNRACCNIEHLQMLERSEHKVKTNKERYAERKDAAHKFWLLHKPTGVALSKEFDVSFSIACRWIREWKV